MVSGSSPLEISWIKDGFGLIEETTPNFSMNFDKNTGLCSLHIIKCGFNDSGLYSCKAKNAAGMAETSAYLKVKEEIKKTNYSPPNVITPLESVEISANSNHLLECVISGDPEPRISWHKDGLSIEKLEPSTATAFKVNNFINIRQLAISNAQPEKHSGKYTCKAENDYGIADCTAVLLVRGNEQTHMV
jgi:titin